MVLSETRSFSRFRSHRHFLLRIQRRVGATEPLIPARDKHRDYQIGFGPLAGIIGQTQVATVMPSVLFRGEKFIAVDDAQPPGSGTIIQHIYVGNQSQFATSVTGIPTSLFQPNSLGSGIKMDVCHPACSIVITVTFVKDCTWNGCLFGKAAF